MRAPLQERRKMLLNHRHFQDRGSEFANPNSAILPIAPTPRGRRHRFRTFDWTKHAKALSGWWPSTQLISAIARFEVGHSDVRPCARMFRPKCFSEYFSNLFHRAYAVLPLMPLVESPLRRDLRQRSLRTSRQPDPPPFHPPPTVNATRRGITSLSSHTRQDVNHGYSGTVGKRHCHP